MDIKTILLKSLSMQKPIQGTRRIHCGRSCIILKYIINGKIFNIKNVKIKRKHKTWVEQIKNYKRAFRVHWNKQNNSNFSKNYSCVTFEDKQTLTENCGKNDKEIQTEPYKTAVSTKDSATQTFKVQQKLSKETQAEIIKTSPKLKGVLNLGSLRKSGQKQIVSLTTSAQQTIASARFSRNSQNLFSVKKTSTSCQTFTNNESKAIQCKRSTQAKGCNTENYTSDSFVQVEEDLPAFNKSLPEELKKRFPLPAEEFGVFIYMLNEIGETVISQNQILNSNTEMMKQIIQITMLQSSKRASNNASIRSTSTQTQQLLTIETKNMFSQTKTEGVKQRRLLLFRGRKSQH